MCTVGVSIKRFAYLKSKRTSTYGKYIRLIFTCSNIESIHLCQDFHFNVAAEV